MSEVRDMIGSLGETAAVLIRKDDMEICGGEEEDEVQEKGEEKEKEEVEEKGESEEEEEVKGEGRCVNDIEDEDEESEDEDNIYRDDCDSDDNKKLWKAESTSERDKEGNENMDTSNIEVDAGGADGRVKTNNTNKIDVGSVLRGSITYDLDKTKTVHTPSLDCTASALNRVRKASQGSQASPAQGSFNTQPANSGSLSGIKFHNIILCIPCSLFSPSSAYSYHHVSISYHDIL